MESSHTPPSGARRSLLTLLGVAVLGGVPLWMAAAQTAPTAAAPPTTPAGAAFLALSAFLIPHARLDARIGQRIYAAFTLQDRAFAAQAAALADVARAHANVEALALAADSASQDTLRRILSAWYLGVVGSDAAGKVLAFDLALMHEQVRDAVAVPSYCNRAPAYWAAPPPHV
ncbi:hypothetical protein AAKU55_002291 [Oxalobacteraceae bacterium GrIS 1.11]